MANSSIEKIVVSLRNPADDILKQQIEMLRERHGADIITTKDADDAAGMIDSVLDGGMDASGILVISDDVSVLSYAERNGIKTNNPDSMRASYMKAMEMLKSFRP